MTERFKYHRGDGFTDNGKYITPYDAVYILNELHEENRRLKKQLKSEHQMLENAILLERTRMGKNCLKQYKEAIQ
ncbi:MAG: hypothetical protein II244_05915 [Clostridia bacterium]|nr:hypothetical protein [Clostridia bacterium]